MQIQMLKAAFAPGPRTKTPDILEKGKIVDLPVADAKALIEKGYASEVKSAKAEKPKKDDDKSDKPATPVA